ncbi:Uma2 family endonuclease [Gloeocapsopsis crepidinum LEGE 06123]|uniref:Uma2 family endonuclease n=1 Tax=Gloeocapsopsis crepidinum LEGE 06123 TaxID=588587 RepID=A0ABR9V1Q5_9CHRO|nr:Uma2 family endonuclease [Gloeocapsopsis crepidinum]MBE9193433.1 Uma2 family endonuclease [Gloeocapsopsis crepidinum LEGE 06123]
MITSQYEYYLSPEDYLEAEKTSQVKHEYIDGQVYAMTEASDAHVTITMNVSMLLRNHLRGSGYRVYMAEMKARIEAINRYYYPDVIVTYDIRDKETDYFKSYPCLIVEVLSESTEASDRGKKFNDYRHLESLQEYDLISQDTINFECFRRNEKGRWELYSYEQGQEIPLASIDFYCPIAAIYEDVSIQVEFVPHFYVCC